jgi:hypothetical protein
MDKCSFCDSDGLMLIPHSKCLTKPKHSFTYCGDCLDSKDGLPCPDCSEAPIPSPSASESKSEVPTNPEKEEAKIPASSSTPAPKPSKKPTKSRLEQEKKERLDFYYSEEHMKKEHLCSICNSKHTSLEFKSPKCRTGSHRMYICEDCPMVLSTCTICDKENIPKSQRPMRHKVIIFSYANALAWEPRIDDWDVTYINEPQSFIPDDFIFPQHAAAAQLCAYKYPAIMFGGYESDLAKTVQMSYFIHFAQNDTLIVRQGPLMNQPRFLHSFCCFFDKRTEVNNVYALGGQNNTPYKTWLSSCEMFSTETEQWKMIPSMPVKMSQFGSTYLNGCIYIFPGFTSYSQMSSDIYKFTEYTGIWEKVILTAVPPVDSVNVSMNIPCNSIPISFPEENKIYVLGGSDGNSVKNDMFCIDLERGVIQRRAPFAFPRASFVATKGENCIYIAFGFGSRMLCEQYDIKQDQWKNKKSYFEAIQIYGEYLDLDINDVEFVMNTHLLVSTPY